MTELKYKVHGEVKTTEEITPEYFKGDSLGAKFGNTLLGFFRHAINSITGWFEERLVNFGVGILVKIEKSGATVLSSLIKELKDKKAIPAFLKPIFDEIENPKGEIGAMLAGSAGTTAIGGLFGAIFDPLMAEVKYQLNTWLKPYIPGIGELVMAWRRGDLDNATLTAWAAANGFSEGMTAIFKSLSRNTLDIQTVIEAKLRDAINEPLENAYLKRLGYDEVDIKVLQKLYMKVPSITDSIIANFKAVITDTELKEIAHKHGIDEEFLNILISTQIQIPQFQYIAGMYLRGFINDSQVAKKFKAQGYSDEDAENMKKLFYYIPPVQDLITMAVREVFTPAIAKRFGQFEDYPEAFTEYAKMQGISEEWAKNYWAMHWGLPAPEQGFDMAHRGIISKQDMEMLMRALDVMPFWRDKLIQLSDSYLIPPMADLTRMAVREVFSPEIAAKFGQFEDLPDPFVYWVKKLGVPEDWAKNYWAAHWDLPSVQMGYDMLHRNIINQGELEMLMRSLDIMPFWRDKLIKLSYAPYTRVDVRRMFKTGVIDRDAVFKTYKDLGYDAEHAGKLTEYTVINAFEEEKELTKGEILKGLKNGLINEAEVTEMLKALDYSDEAIGYFITTANLEKLQVIKNSNLDYIKANYQTMTWDYDRTQTELTKLNLTPYEIEYYILTWSPKTKEKTALPTKAELKGWLSKDIISIDRYVQYMQALSYTDETISYYINEIAMIMQGGE